MKKIYFLLLLNALNYSLKAQWTNDKKVNTLVSTEFSTYGSTGLPQQFHRSDNKTWIVYPGNDDHRAVSRVQLLDENGYRLFGDSGMAISTRANSASIGIACMDSANNLYVPFDGEGDVDDGYRATSVQKISASGNLLWGNGIALGRGYSSSAAYLTTGELVVAWVSFDYIYYQKISAGGTIVWSTNKKITSVKTTDQPQVVSGLHGKFSMVYTKDSVSYYRNTMFQTFNNNGKAYFPPLKISTLETSLNGLSSIVTNDDTVYVGYYGKRFPNKSRTDAFIQKINPGGTLPWGPDGVAFADYSTEQEIVEKKIYIAKQNLKPQRIWALCTINGAGGAMSGISAQLLDFNGNRYFGKYGKELFPISLNNALVPYGAAPLVYNGSLLFLVQNYFDYRLRLAQADENGNIVGTDSLRTVCALKTYKRIIMPLVRLSGNNCLAGWVENRDNTDEKIYAQPMPIQATGQQALKQNNIVSIKSVYPNPALNNVTININSDLAAAFTIYITDVSGNLFTQTKQNLNKGNNTINLNVSALKPGSYFIKVMNENNNTSMLFYKQ